MSHDETVRVTNELLTRSGSGAAPDHIAALFSTDAVVDIAGDVGALPWIGHKVGRKAASDFFRDLRDLLEPVSFEVIDVLTNGSRAVILGQLASRSKSTGKTMETAFAIVLTVSDGEITHYRMLEDSFAVSQAAKG